MSIAIVGSGPTGMYALAGLVTSSIRLRIVLFEKGEKAGFGMPYSPDSCHSVMLANIASIEIPPLCQSYLGWMRTLPEGKLASYGVKRDQLDDRLFTSRLLMGEYFRAQLLELVEKGRANGHQIELREATHVTDIDQEGQGIRVLTDAGEVDIFDKVVLATGHDFQPTEPVMQGYFSNPWSGLIKAKIGAVTVGVMGTSLSAIDAVMAVAQQHGRFEPSAKGLIYVSTAHDLSITMMSRHGLLPEADFYCPIPYRPLQILTESIMADLLAADRPLPGGLDQLYQLFVQEITLADPAYATRLGLAQSSADVFADRYFAERLLHEPFEWASHNVVEAERNKARKITVPWRYAILRMHEKLQALLPTLSPCDRARFDRGLGRVFIDNYAAVPSASIWRLLALHRAGILHVIALGDDYDLNIKPGLTIIAQGHHTHHFKVFIDARGQKSLTSDHVPFPALRIALQAAGQKHPQVDEYYRLVGVPGFAKRIFWAAIPYLMHHKPFIQGIIESHEIGGKVADGLRADMKPITPQIADGELPLQHSFMLETR